MPRGWLLIVIFMLILGNTGCGNDVLDGKEIVKVSIECADVCKNVKPYSFKDTDVVSFETADELNVFKRAITGAKVIKGEVDYGVFFYMQLALNDGLQKKYVLNIADEDGRSGLLVDTDNGKGYIISDNLTGELKAIIW
ncbi:hypothetical protein [Paenibacillus glycanilyticus]|uniref:hypothetical protein n=1 Tax=Paenibacillus glycanilyticus TaxID=126569 RepID=UPI001910366D|nr:hypothetical protein [Paenibacillus glycanilyticus]